MKKYHLFQSHVSSLGTKLTNSPEVELCGYSIPHPSEAKMNLRIQTYGLCLASQVDCNPR